jgi:alcohol dehydrogenase
VSAGAASALVLEAPRRLVRRELPLPVIGDDDALLRVEACGLCGTDHEQYNGHQGPSDPCIPGHETVGVIETIGSAAADRWGVAAGDRVAVEVFQSCRTCPPCRAGEYRRCKVHGMRDIYSFVPVDTAPGLWGGYATHQYLSPDSLVIPVPAGLDAVTATLFNPLGAGLRWAVTVPGTGTGDVVAILGPGIRGLSAVVAAKDAGAGFVMVTGYGERDAERLETATKLGADLAVDVATIDPARALKEATGGLADVVVDVTAKAPTALAQGVRLCRPGGTFVLAGIRGTEDTPGFFPDHVVAKELRLQGALGVDTSAYRRALDLLAADPGRFSVLSRRVVDLDGAEELIRSMAGDGDQPPPVHGVVAP